MGTSTGGSTASLCCGRECQPVLGYRIEYEHPGEFEPALQHNDRFDDNHDGNTKARPAGIGRNTGIGPKLFNMNINLQKTVALKSEKTATRRAPPVRLVRR